MPVCPRCLHEQQQTSSLQISHVVRGDSETVVEGVLQCAESTCQLEFPVIDAVPVIVANVRTVLAEQVGAIITRRDLSPMLESILGDASGQGSDYDTRRQHLSIYAADGYGEFAENGPALGLEKTPASHIVACLETGLAMLEDAPGPTLDLGCGVGRSTFELARETEDPVLGLDLSFPMLQLAQQIHSTGRGQFPLRRLGVVYDNVEVATPFAGTGNVDFWLADAAALPFRAGRLPRIVALNLLDCLQSPIAFLHSLADLLTPGGQAIVACPYDWSTAATAMESWLGGHSQRGGFAGNSDELLRALLTPGAHPQSVSNLRIVGEDPNVRWATRIHSRSTTEYLTHVLALRKTPEAAPEAG